MNFGAIDLLNSGGVLVRVGGFGASSCAGGNSTLNLLPPLPPKGESALEAIYIEPLWNWGRYAMKPGKEP